MCLITYNFEPTLNKKQAINKLKCTATKDIVVYKRLKRYKKWANKNGKGYIYESPYQRFKYNLGYEYNVQRFQIFESCIDNKLRIYQGLHSYTNYETARNRKNINEVIVKCIIPKGSKYFLGIHNDIVSDKLILVKELK